MTGEVKVSLLPLYGILKEMMKMKQNWKKFKKVGKKFEDEYGISAIVSKKKKKYMKRVVV